MPRSNRAKTATRETAAATPTSTSQAIDMKLARQAMAKNAAGEIPTKGEIEALRRLERAQEEKLRRQYYATIPARHWQEFSGKQASQIKSQASTYDLPFGGETVNLPELVKRLHEFLAENAALFSRKNLGGDAAAALPSEDAAVLADGTDALSISRVSMKIAARRLKAAAESGLVGAVDFENIKRSLGELRLAEQEYLDLKKQREELLERDLVQVMVGMAANRLIKCVEILENAIPTEFEVWLADPDLAKAPTEERRSKVRKFVAQTCNEVRRQEADGLEKLIQEARKEVEE